MQAAFEQRCLVSNNFLLMEASRPVTDCASVCAGVGGAEELRAPTRAAFAALAYASRPVVVRGGAAGWSALDTFGAAYFRAVYEAAGADAYAAVDSHCQFFPFRTEFASLREALNMAPERIALEPGTKPWYIGWYENRTDIFEINLDYEIRLPIKL